jgi:hypothetical protein
VHGEVANHEVEGAAAEERCQPLVEVLDFADTGLVLVARKVEGDDLRTCVVGKEENAVGAERDCADGRELRRSDFEAVLDNSPSLAATTLAPQHRRPELV